MKLIKLYIENFSCHQYSEIDFSSFNSAIIIGKVENSDLYSNGVGKSTIFKAIEYVLFNQSDSNLEKVIRDDCNSCKVCVDFNIKDTTYRILRTRTRKGTSDVSFFVRTELEGNDDDVFKLDADAKYWKNVSGRRSADTEKEISNILKMNFASFRGTAHFAQNDNSGLASATPARRKAILKESLKLLVFNKLEKIARDRLSYLSKEMDKADSEISFISEKIAEASGQSEKIPQIDELIVKLSANKEDVSNELSKIITSKSTLDAELSLFDANRANVNNQKISAEKELLSSNAKIKSLTDKKNSINKEAKVLIDELKKIEAEKTEVEKNNTIKIDDLAKLNEELSSKIVKNDTESSHLSAKLEELNVPLPDGSSCKYCRQTIMQEHMEKCRQDTQNQIKEINEKLQKIASDTKNLKTQLLENKKQIKQAQECNDKLRSIASRISSITSEMSQKKQLFEEYKEMLSNEEASNNQLKDNFEQISAKLAQSETDNILEIRKKVKEENDKINVLKLDIKKIENDLMEEQKTKAIILSKIKEAEALEEKKKSIEVEIKSKSKYSKAYPYVVQALSSSGIPNIIIQNMLEDLQSEVNELLPDLHPGLQLTFSTEKTKSDGTVDDTLDIVYYLNSKERDFEQLSGAQKLAATFGLKLGLAFFLKKNLGMELNLLLLDEIDQSLDKAGVDAFANIVKRFEDEFTILVITHNDRLKDKFSHAILVEQDYDRVSKAKVISI